MMMKINPHHLPSTVVPTSAPQGSLSFRPARSTSAKERSSGGAHNAAPPSSSYDWFFFGFGWVGWLVPEGVYPIHLFKGRR